MGYKIITKEMLKKVITVSGALTRSLIGIGASALLLFAFKKKKKK
jgi:hypothetical protein